MGVEMANLISNFEDFEGKKKTDVETFRGPLISYVITDMQLL